MPGFNIHWKGCPHHRLPRIQVASTPRTSIRTRSQIAAQQVLQIPLCSALEQERKKQRFNFRLRKRRGRNSRSTSAVVRSRRQAARRARQHIQVFGWGTSQAELANRATFESSTLRTSSIRARVRTRSSAALRNPQPQGSIIPSTDGAASSSIRRAKAYRKEPANLYSLMHVAEVPVYWKSGESANRKKSSNSDRLRIHSTRRSGAEYVHVGPLETVSERNTYRGSQTLDRRRTYDCRIDPKKQVEDHRSKSGPAQIGADTGGPRTRATSQALPKAKQQSRASAELQEAVNSLALQTKAKGSDSVSNKTVAPSVFSDNASRSSSQRKALQKFTREIELYLQACRSLPKGSLVATPSLTNISAYTVDDFKPYQAQFQSAGLAVTSDEQRGLVKLQETPSPPPPPPKDLRWSKTNSSSDDKMGFRNNKQNERSQKRREPSYASGSTGTTIMGFTPPYERSYPPPKPARRPSSDSDHTIIGFTPPHERVAPLPARPPPLAPKTPTKKSLPWLRRPDASPEPTSPTKKLSAAPEAVQHRPSTPLEGLVTKTDSPTKEKTPENLRKSDPTDPSWPGVSQLSTNVQWNEMKYSSEKAVINAKRNIPTLQAQVSTRTDDVDTSAYTTVYTTTCADVSTQTNADVETSWPNVQEATMKNDEVQMARPPIISGRNRTFPITKNNCKGDCNAASEPVVASSAPKSRKRSRVKWEGVNREIQTDTISPIGPQPKDENQSQRDRKSTFKSELTRGKRNPTFPSPSSATRRPEPFQASPSLRSSNKSVDEEKLETDTYVQGPADSNVPSTENKTSLPHTRQAPPPTFCSKCANELKSAALEPNPQLESQSEPELEPEPAPRAELDHDCPARPSLVCQQCFPSRRTSATISSLQTSLWEVQYAPSRRSTRPIIPAGPVTYIEDPVSLPTVDQGVDDTVKNDSSPEEGSMPIQTVQNIVNEYTSEPPIADPIKKPSLPRINLKLPPATERKQYSTTSRPKPTHPAPQASKIVNLPNQLPDLASISSLDTVPLNLGKITDKQVFKGLHVATAAACDEDVDKWIEEITGYGVKKFLADLSRFEGLGVNTLADVARRAARQRRERVRAWEVIREARVAEREMQNNEKGLGERCEERGNANWVIGEMGVVAGEEREDKAGCRIVHRQDCKGSKAPKR